MKWLRDCFADLPDPRTGNAKRHNLLEMLTIALVASICGAESCTDFADFARDRATLFREFLKLQGGLPSHDTFSRLFRLIDPQAFAACFGGFLERLATPGRACWRSTADAAPLVRGRGATLAIARGDGVRDGSPPGARPGRRARRRERDRRGAPAA